MKGGKMLKIYLMESMRGKIHLATKLYLHDGSHSDVLELTGDGYNNIAAELVDRNRYRDSFGNSWYLRNKGVNGEVYFAAGIRRIKETILVEFEDVYDIICHNRVCKMDKVRLLEIWQKH
jgi:hypothetical protein